MIAEPDPQPSGSNPPAVEVEVVHLICHCQLATSPRLALCGIDVTGLRQGLPSLMGAEQSCVVCTDLARTVVIARRCQRCPR